MTTPIKINGVGRSVDVDSDTPLLWVWRDAVGMTGTKFGCGVGLCGAGTVHLDGVATRPRVTTVAGIGGSELTTRAATGATAAGARIQKAWLDQEVVQCGCGRRPRGITKLGGERPAVLCAGRSPMTGR